MQHCLNGIPCSPSGTVYSYIKSTMSDLRTNVHALFCFSFTDNKIFLAHWNRKLKTSQNNNKMPVCVFLNEQLKHWNFTQVAQKNRRRAFAFPCMVFIFSPKTLSPTAQSRYCCIPHDNFSIFLDLPNNIY